MSFLKAQTTQRTPTTGPSMPKWAAGIWANTNKRDQPDDGLTHCKGPGCDVAIEAPRGAVLPAGWVGVIEGFGGFQTRTTPFHSRGCLVAWVREHVLRQAKK